MESVTLEKIISEFNANWKTRISMINTRVMQYFTNFNVAMTVLQAVLSRLVMYYSKFLSLVQAHLKNSAVGGRLKVMPVDMQHVFVEIKKFRVNQNSATTATIS